MKTISVWITLGLVLGALLLGAGGAWFVRGWHDDSKQLSVAKQDVQDIQAASKQLVADQVKARDSLQADNDKTAASMNDLNTSLGKQANAIRKLQNTFAGISIGSCTFNADGDELLQQSYEAAFPTTVPGTSGAGKATPGNGPGTSPRPAR